MTFRKSLVISFVFKLNKLTRARTQTTGNCERIARKRVSHSQSRIRSNCRTLISFLLPPASEEWGKVLFSVCLSVHISTPGGVGYPKVPHPADRGGYPIPGLDGSGYPGVRAPARTGWSTPYLDLGWGTPPRPELDGVPPIRQSNAASGMPLGFTQEDFLVLFL